MHLPFHDREIASDVRILGRSTTPQSSIVVPGAGRATSAARAISTSFMPSSAPSLGRRVGPGTVTIGGQVDFMSRGRVSVPAPGPVSLITSGLG